MEKSNSKKIELNIDITKNYSRLSRRKWLVFIWSIVICLALIIVNLSIGSSEQNIFQILLNSITNSQDTNQILLLNMRLPHVLCSIIAGATLGICGCLLQSSLGNPLASPSTVGISQGAACGACIAIVIFGQALSGQIMVIVFAFIFALIPTAIIYTITKFKKLDSTAIILSGVAMTIFFGGIITLTEYFIDSSQLAEIIFWTFGSVSKNTFPQLGIMAIMLVIVFVYALANYLGLNALECGDITAHSVGVNTKSTRLRHLILAAVSASCITAFCGTINFIGLLSPHIMRRFVGSNYKYLIPASALCGIMLLTLSDIASLTILPGVILPIGAITSFIGAPLFVWIIIRKKQS